MCGQGIDLLPHVSLLLLLELRGFRGAPSAPLFFALMNEKNEGLKGEREMGNGEWGMGNGEWGMGNG
jgi:hypothetical protein